MATPSPVGHLTPREQELLAVLAEQAGFKSIPVLQHYYPPLRRYSKGQLFHSTAALIRLGYATRTITNPEREARYQITRTGLVLAKAARDARNMIP